MGDRGSGRPTWAEIDLFALERNLQTLRERAPGRRVIAVVKADGYGHGLRVVSTALVGAGVDSLGVATLAEAAELRSTRVDLPILLLEGLHAADEADYALEQRMTPAVCALEQLGPIEAAAERAGRPFPVHLKFDTGMNRLGLPSDDLDALLERVTGSERLDVQGVMSHLACADDGSSPETALQRERFAAIVARMRERGSAPDWIHLDNSPAVLHGPTEGTTAIRPGLALYGADPTVERAASLVPVMSLRTRVHQVRDVPAGTRVGYGGSYVTREATRIATLPLGYADGLPRAAAEGHSVAVDGKRFRLAGRVSMDLTAVDAGRGGTVEPGDEVLVFGRHHATVVPVEELADAAGTIAYEILVGVPARVPRVAVRRA